jgi:hypothetical protein
MDYTNQQKVRFKIAHKNGSRYDVKYYTGVSQWPRNLRNFQCPTDELRQEMFFVLGNMRLCTTCKVELLGHNDDPNKETCQSCILKVSALGADGAGVPECPVCYQKMLTVDGSKNSLACRHEVCLGCTRKLMKPPTQFHYDPSRGTFPTWTITCPLCRDVANYDAALRVTRANTAF